MTWIDRLQPELILTSPNGITFNAGWRGDPREMEKKLGVFEYPKIPGAVVQDLDVRATRWQLSFFFEGPDHDITASLFYAACATRGLWQIDHPTKGSYRLQLILVREEIQPVDSGNITAFVTEWIEPMDGFLGRSTTQRQAEVRQRVFKLQETARGQLATTAKPSRLVSFRNAVTENVDKVKRALTPLTRTVAEVNAAVESVHRGIATAVTDTGLNVLALAGQIQAAVTLPALTIDSIGVRLDYYSNLLSQVVGVETDINGYATQEVIGVSCLAAAATILADSEPATREEAVTHLETINQIFTDMTDGLDSGQTTLGGQIITEQFFSQSASYNDAALLVASVNDLLLRRLFDLSAAKRFTLQRPRTPVEIAITEKVDLDLFISSNSLTGNDILLLPAGREVVVYL